VQLISKCARISDERRERGPQISIIPPAPTASTHRCSRWRRQTSFEIPDNMVGVVTTKDGKPLATGEIAGKEVPGHNMYQDAEAFITMADTRVAGAGDSGGAIFHQSAFRDCRNQSHDKRSIANVGVVIAYVGEEGKDVNRRYLKHGNLVSRGQKESGAIRLIRASIPSIHSRIRLKLCQPPTSFELGHRQERSA